MANHPWPSPPCNFRDPEKIAWDLGDGTEIEPGPGPGVVKPTFLVSHAYEKAGTYVVKAYDSGDRDQPPLAGRGAGRRRSRGVCACSRIEPAAGTELEFSAVNFNTPDRLRWDMGDGTAIPGEKENRILTGSRSVTAIASREPTRSRSMTGEGITGRRPVQLASVVSPA